MTEETPKRGRGRPSRDSVDVGPDALVEAARQVLMKTDPALVTRQAVAAHAGVAPRLVRYYFGNMRQLLGEVVSGVLRQVRTDMAAKREDSPTDRIRFRVERTFRLFNENRGHHKLVSAMFYGDEEESPERAEWVKLLNDTVSDIQNIVDEGVRSGEFRPIEPRFLHMMIVSICEFWSSNEPIIGIIFKDDSDRPDLERRYVEFATDIILNGVKR